MAELRPKFELDCQMAKNYVSAVWCIELNCSPREPLCLCRIERIRKNSLVPSGSLNKSRLYRKKDSLAKHVVEYLGRSVLPVLWSFEGLSEAKA